MRPWPIAAAAALFLAFSPALAQAGGEAPAQAVRLQLGGGSAQSGVKASEEGGVSVWRGAAQTAGELAGAPSAAPASAAHVKIVVIHRRDTRLNRLRTQGFYSGHPGRSRRFAQGFWSGPADWRAWR